MSSISQIKKESENDKLINALKIEPFVQENGMSKK